MRPFGKCAMSLSILLTLVANPTHAQVQQRSVMQPQMMPHQQTNRAMVAAENKARHTNRYFLLSNEYSALKFRSAPYVRTDHPALRRTQLEIISHMREIDRSTALIKNKLDSMSEMGEMESLRLQMAMDRMSKMMSTLSNLLKKASDTASGIAQNIK